MSGVYSYDFLAIIRISADHNRVCACYLRSRHSARRRVGRSSAVSRRDFRAFRPRDRDRRQSAGGSRHFCCHRGYWRFFVQIFAGTPFPQISVCVCLTVLWTR